MEKLNFANHLGFSDWQELLRSSNLEATACGVHWYVTLTNTWYKWIVWSDHYDVYYNHASREDALSTLKWRLNDMSRAAVEWTHAEEVSQVDAQCLGLFDPSIAF